MMHRVVSNGRSMPLICMRRIEPTHQRMTNSTNTEIRLLTGVIDRTRQYTLQYMEHLQDVDPHHEFVCEGKRLNTLFWLTAHLTATENGLLLLATGGPFERFSWAKHYGPGSTGLPKDQCPPYKEVRATMDAVHERAMTHLPTLEDIVLERPNNTGFLRFGPLMRDVLIQAIRHENYHTGQIGWLCKLYGRKTV